MFASNVAQMSATLVVLVVVVGCGAEPDQTVAGASTAPLDSLAWTTPTGICSPDELQCGSDCVVPDPSQTMDALCWGGSVYPWCFSDYEGPFYACPVGKVDEGGTRYACTYVNNDPLNCGACGVVCRDGQTCTSGRCG